MGSLYLAYRLRMGCVSLAEKLRFDSIKTRK